MKPSKIYYYACIAFAPEYDSSFIKEKLRLFLRRFFGAQFKRASSSEAADLTAVNLETFQMPADARADAFIAVSYTHLDVYKRQGPDFYPPLSAAHLSRT